MGSVRLTARDYRAILRLIAEVQELPRDRMVRLSHLVGGIAQLVRARAGVSLQLDDFVPGKWMGKPVWALDAGDFDDAGRRAVTASIGDPDCVHPFMLRMAEHNRVPVLALRQHMVGDTEWYSSHFTTNYAKAAGVDSMAQIQFPLAGNGRVVGIGLHRGWGDTQFSEKDHMLMVEIGRTIGWLVRDLAVDPDNTRLAPSEDRFGALPPRLRATLKHLLTGKSEKQVALAMGVTRTTAHEYVKQLYRALGVTSRPELMLLALAPPPEKAR